MHKSIQSSTFFQIATLAVFGLIVVGVYLLFFRQATYLEVTLKLSEVPGWFFYEIKPGMVEKDALGRMHVEVVSVNAFPTLIDKDTKNVFVTLKLKSVYSQSSNAYTFNSRPVLIGNLVRTNPGNVLVEGEVVAIAGQSVVSTIKKVRLETQILKFNSSEPETVGALKYIADSLSMGDRVVDQRGTTFGMLIDKKVVPAQRTVVASNGTIFSANDPIKKDIFLTFELDVLEKGGRYYIYNDYWLAVDVVVPIEFQNVLVYPTVTAITEL